MKMFALLLGLVAVAYASDKSCTATIATFPGYTGSYAPTGRIVVTGNNFKDKTKMKYNLAGLQPSQANGVHIHTGITCNDLNYVSTPYYALKEGEEDPWTSSAYADSAGRASGELEVKSGINYAGTVGHALVVLDSSNTKIGCGVCVETCTAKINKYPGYDGDMKVEGTVSVSANVANDYGSILNVTYDITGATPTTDNSDPQYAGIHVHVGVNCDKDYVAGHFYATTSDPWTTSERTDAAGDTAGFFSVATGLTYQAQIGHTIVIHADDTDSTRIGCGVCEADGYDDSSSMMPDWAWILVVIASSLLCLAVGIGVVMAMKSGGGGGGGGGKGQQMQDGV
jgi:Cu/Zn superoxide dismutase